MLRRRRTAALAAATALAAAGLALAPSTPASADNGTYVNSASIGSFYMGAESAKTFTITIDADGAEEVDWTLSSAKNSCYVFEYGDASYAGGGIWKDTFTITQSDRGYDNSCAGAMVLEVDAWNWDTYGSDSEEFVINFKRQARIVGHNYGPEPVRKGGTVTGTAKLERISWVDNRYHGDSNATLYSQFRTTSGSYSTVRTVTTDGSGYVTSKNTQSVDGCWRFVAPGYSTTTSYTNKGDCVDSV